ncbi:MAG: sulfatase-like hydrolase/transferase [candidate division KSB1 bacterium]|nr:sulfatase-like hydrolase/transferase [candidate division KSB1 bacterium]
MVFIICDQMRGDAMSCMNNRNAHTPNLDRMASNGVLFENYFSNNPVCQPARVTLFSGLHPHQHGKLTNKSGRKNQCNQGIIARILS